MKRSIFALAAILLMSCTQKNQQSALLLSDDIIEEVNFEDIACDIEVFSLNSPYLMKGIEMCYGIDDIIFCISEDHRTIYWVKGNSVISKLDKYGRGHGEYTYVNDFTYDPQDSILFIHTMDNKLMKYQGLNCKFIGECSDFKSVSGIQAINSRTLLANCSVAEDDGLSHAGLYLLDAETGKTGKLVCPMDYSQNYFYEDEFSKYHAGDSIMFIIPGPGEDASVVYMFHGDAASPMLSFRYDDKCRIPESVLIRGNVPVNFLDDPSNHEKLITIIEYSNKESCCNGGFIPVYHNGRIMFWTFTKEPTAILNTIKDNDVKRYLISMPGFGGMVFPTTISGNYYISTFNTSLGIDIDDEDKLTPLGRKIKQEIDSSDGNPVFLKYHIK